MIHYHGTPITPISELYSLAGRNFCVSHASPDQIKKVHEIGQSVLIDNGAFSKWKTGKKTNWSKYYDFCAKWLDYKTTWAIIPDEIEGDENTNKSLVTQWPLNTWQAAPVWHLHESLSYLRWLCDRFVKVCFGSSGQYSQPGTQAWHERIIEAFELISDSNGKMHNHIHMLRGMQFCESLYPFASVDSTDVARNHNRPQNTALKLVKRWDQFQCPAIFNESAIRDFYKLRDKRQKTFFDLRGKYERRVSKMVKRI